MLLYPLCVALSIVIIILLIINLMGVAITIVIFQMTFYFRELCFRCGSLTKEG